MVTNESFDKAWNEYVASGLKPKNLLVTENNGMHILRGVVIFERDFKRMPKPEEMHSIIKYLGDMDANPPGVLQYHHSGAPDAAPQTLPHEDIRELANIRTMADVKRVLNLPKEQLQKYMRLRGPQSVAFKEFNERIQHIQKHRIQAAETTVEQPAESPAQAENREAYESARARVTALSHRDCGSTGSGPGQDAWTKVAQFKTKITNLIDHNEKHGTAGAAVLKHVDQHIADFRSSGVR